MSRIEYTINNLMNIVENTEEAKSRILDTDYAKESANLAKAQVLAQAGTAMLAQANQSQQYVLNLLRQG
jgi:flagellin